MAINAISEGGAGLVFLPKTGPNSLKNPVPTTILNQWKGDCAEVTAVSAKNAP